ncbi:hypothetical protein [Paenibacillus sp. YAF4_2]|uniref:hypothetical protein n=1 Tax=Paenibacillus sp. YAF4_2 TaxID=3233085 RepID=UPI003F98FC2A
MKTSKIAILVALIILIGSSTLLYQQHETSKQTKMKLKSVLESSLYKIWLNYDDIAQSQTNKVTQEHVEQIAKKLNVIEAYSSLVDQAEGTFLLVPIANHLTSITEYLSKQLQQKPALSEDDQSVYLHLTQFTKDFAPKIGDVYYVPGAWEGPKAALKPNKTAVHEMAKSRDQLKAYVAELSERSTK